MRAEESLCLCSAKTRVSGTSQPVLSATMGESSIRRALRWSGLAVIGVVGLFMLLAAIGSAVQAVNGKPLPRGDSRVGDLIGAAVCFALAGLCAFLMWRAARRSPPRRFRAYAGDANLLATIGPRSGKHQFTTADAGQGQRRGRRARRGKPLSEMTVAELRRAMWLSPVALGITVLAGAARIAVAAIEEELPLWLGIVLIVLIAAWPAVLTVRVRRRYRARLLEFSDPITGTLPFAGARATLPFRVRLWLIAAPVLTAIALFFSANLPGDGDTCVTKGISTVAARQGICQRGANLFGGGVTYNVVDAGTPLSMPDYQARLIGSTTAPITVGGPYASAALYPDHRGMLVSFELEITNTSDKPLQPDLGETVAATITEAPGSTETGEWRPATHLTTAPVPQLDLEPLLAADQSEEGWVSIIVPILVFHLRRLKSSTCMRPQKLSIRALS